MGYISKFKKIPYSFYVVLFIGLFFLAGECILATAHFLTHSSKFSTLANAESNYPKNPEEYLKIAVFGESAAAGYPSGKGFSKILEYEFKKIYPHTKIYIRNYAQPGYPFHRHQAEVLKHVIDKYDFFLIYAGNNEVNNYLDDCGYFRKIKYRDRKSFIPFREKSNLLNFLESKSRIYCLIKKAYNKFIKPYVKMRERNYYRHWRFKEFEPKRVLPEDEIVKISINFEKDIEEIARIATKYGKHVIISSVPTYETWKPFFSVQTPDLAQEDIELFKKNYEHGLFSYNQKDFELAIEYFLKAYKIDEHVAILNYMIGYSYLMLGDTKRGHQFLIRGIDDDGYPIRALSSLFNVAKKISDKYNNIHFADTIKNFEDLSDSTITYKELFYDLQHPNFLGHIIIAYNFLNKIAESEPVKFNRFKYNYFDLNSTDLNSLLKHYKKELSVSSKEESWDALMIARWHISIAALSAYPDDFLDFAKDYINYFFEESDKDANDKATRLIFLALVESGRIKGNSEKALTLVNQALNLSPDYVKEILYRKMALGDLIIDKFKEMGIFYSRQKKSFVFEKKANI